MNKRWEFDLDTGDRQFKTWVYSDTGKDIESRFKPYKVSNIKEIKQTNTKTPSEQLQDQLEPIIDNIPNSWSDLETV
jgi:hypothetical protein